MPGSLEASREPGEPIHPATRIGAVHLTVRDLERTVVFYEGALGLTARYEGRDRAQLLAGEAPLVTLIHAPAARIVTRSAGLYHFAVLLPSRAALADALRRLFRTRTSLDGASDHGVSEALYLADPEGNGIELYRDRPRADWPWRNGRLAMGTGRLDLESLMREPEASGDGGLPAGTVIGHVHLRVSEIAPAESFYCDRLGFALMQRYGDSASFVSAGRYHHHVAFNTWESRGGPPAPGDAAGLAHFEVLLPDESARREVVARLEAVNTHLLATASGPMVRDPSGNAMVLGLGSTSLLDLDPGGRA